MRPQDVPIIRPVTSTSPPQCCGMDMWAWQALPGVVIWRCNHRIHHPLVADIMGQRAYEDDEAVTERAYPS